MNSDACVLESVYDALGFGYTPIIAKGMHATGTLIKRRSLKFLDRRGLVKACGWPAKKEAVTKGCLFYRSLTQMMAKIDAANGVAVGV